MGLNGDIVAVGDLTLERRDEMYALMQRHYEHVERDEFERDLAEKDWVIEVSQPESNTLCGFSTQMVFELSHDGQPMRGLFSGDTIVDPRYWRNNPLAGLWGHLALALVDQRPWDNLCWFLICKGYKTYRFLPTFFHEYYPRPGVVAAPRVQERLDAFGRRKFPDRFDPATGIVRADAASCRLRDGVADVTPQRMQNPDVRYFCERNPGHADGDELCCLAPLSRDNFTAAAWRVIEGARHLLQRRITGIPDRRCIDSKVASFLPGNRIPTSTSETTT